jgi:hypothetical protein
MAMTVEEAQAALDAAQATRDSAVTMKEKIAAGKEVAAAQKALTAAKSAARKEESAATAAAAAKAEADRPTTGAEMAAQLKGVRPIVGPGESPDVVGGAGFEGYFDYKPLDEKGRVAIFGYNEQTGKSFTDEEIAKRNAGWNPFAEAVGYEIDPRTGNLNVLLENGSVLTTGAQYQYSSQGYVVPQLSEDYGAFGYDEFGRAVNAQGQPITQEDRNIYNTLMQMSPNLAMKYARGGVDALDDEDIPKLKTAGLKVLGNKIVDTNVSGNKLSTGFTQTSTSRPSTSTAANLATGNVSTGRNPYQVGSTQYEKFEERRSAFDILYNEFDAMGLGALVKPLERLLIQDVGPQQFAIELRATDEYKARFSANDERVKKGLRVLTPREYLTVEDSYRQTLRTYGLKQFDNDQYVRQFIANDISAAELSDRVATAVQRVQNADPAISRTLRDYYGIGQTDLVAYVLDPNQQLQKIQRQVAAAEIGTAARRQGLEAGVAVSEQLAAQGITEAQAQKGYSTIADILPTAEKLSQIYGATMEGYGQAEAEQEVFNTLASAQRKRQRLVGREVAAFSGQSGLGRSSLGTATGGQY